MIANGLFYSKLAYCLPLFCNVWGMETYREAETRYCCFTKEDNRKLQVLQNQVARLLIEKPCDRKTPTKDLLKMSGDLSIQQIWAPRTVTLIKKVLLTGKPTYLSERLIPRIGSQRFGMMLTQDRAPLSLIREGFIYRGISLFNNLPDALKSEAKLSKFKSAARRWIQENVAVKP